MGSRSQKRARITLGGGGGVCVKPDRRMPASRWVSPNSSSKGRGQRRPNFRKSALILLWKYRLVGRENKGWNRRIRVEGKKVCAGTFTSQQQMGDLWFALTALRGAWHASAQRVALVKAYALLPGFIFLTVPLLTLPRTHPSGWEV